MKLDSKIYLAGHQGLIGSAILRNLEERGYNNIVTCTHKELDLTRQKDVENFFESEKPEYVFIAAAKAGGIYASNHMPAEFLYDNLMIETNIIHSAYKYNIKKLLLLGSSCIYPKLCPQPIKEEYLLTSSLESTGEANAIAKIAGLELCKFYRRQYGCDFISVMPTNVYGINDNFDLKNSHVIPALIRKFHDAKINNVSEVLIWGTGNVLREFMFVDDLADAIIFLMLNYSSELHINIGTGEEITINQLVEIIKQVVAYKGKITNDLTKPDGTPRKFLDISLLQSMGWKYKVELKEGIKRVYEWYIQQL